MIGRAAIIAALFTRGCAALGGILLSLVVARFAGAEGLGRFTVFISLLGAFGILARRGQDSLLMRAVAWSQAQGRQHTPAALLCFGLSRILWPVAALGAVGVILLSSGALGKPFPGSVVLFPAALLLLTGLALVAGYVKGLSRAWLAPVFGIGGVSLVAAAVLGIVLFAYDHPPEEAGTGIFGAALLVLTLIAVAMVSRDAPGLRQHAVLTDADRAELRTGQLAFTMIVLSGFLLQAGALLLAAPFLPDGDIGLLRAAERLALLVSFPFLAVTPVIAPRIVCLSRDGRRAQLRRLIMSAIILTAGMGGPVMITLLLWPERALALIGPEFGAAADYLRIMALVQFTAGSLGPLAVLLNMSGRERTSMWISLVALGMAATLIPTFSWAYGSTGFVLAYAMVIVMRVCFLGLSVAWSAYKPTPKDKCQFYMK